MNAESSAADRRVRGVLSPEGVEIPFELASVSDRLLAFAIDVVLIYGVIAIFYVVALLLGMGAGALPLALATIAAFFVRNFYFVYMEMKWGGTTIGKRKMGLRAISRDGGPLTAEAVFARNLTRDLEVFLPVLALTAPRQVVSAGPGWGVLIGVSWIFVLALFPLLNKDRLRVGDIVGGTIVVRSPQPVLLADLAQEDPYATIWESTARIRERYVFTAEQLDLYGIHELQILEDLLRDKRPGQDALFEKVCDNIKRKIGWPREQWKVNPDHFLLEFYKAQRARLEHQMLFGDRREKKRD